MSAEHPYCNTHGAHLGDECPECPYEAKIAELQSKLEQAKKLLNETIEAEVDLQLYAEDNKRVLEATEKAFKDVCDERDSLSRRLGRVESEASSLRESLGDEIRKNDELKGNITELATRLEQRDNGDGTWSTVVERHEPFFQCSATLPISGDGFVGQSRCLREAGHDGDHYHSTDRHGS